MALRTLERIVVSRIAVIHTDKPSGSFHIELHEIVGYRRDVTVSIEDLDLDVRDVLTVGKDSLAIDAQSQGGRRTSCMHLLGADDLPAPPAHGPENAGFVGDIPVGVRVSP